MAGKRDDRLRDGAQGLKRDKSREFIQEKIVRQPVSKRQIARRILMTAFCGALFGVVSAVCFAASGPVAQKLFGSEPVRESSQITIPKDEPETVPPATEAVVPQEGTVETEPVEEKVREEIANYRYSVDDINKLFNSLRTVASDAESSLAVVHSIQHDTDWFDNSIENTGQFSGVIIARTRGEILLLVPEEAVEEADSLEVAFSNGELMTGEVKQKDSVVGLAMISVDATQMENEQFKKIRAIDLGNSFGVKQGDLVVAVGAPAGIVHSSDYGFISYVARNVQMTDGSMRIFYTNICGNASAGTFLLNTSGELIGWVTEHYADSDGSGMTTVAAISDYKGVLEMMSNGAAVPYIGIRGQDVTQAMKENGMPSGIYVVSVETDSPAYNAGIQPGDLVTWMNGQAVGSIKDFQGQVEKLHPEDKVKVAVQRSNGKNEYIEIEFEVTIGAR
ncbi:MAG: S1C family serine protease [Enterocloster sp.]